MVDLNELLINKWIKMRSIVNEILIIWSDPILEPFVFEVRSFDQFVEHFFTLVEHICRTNDHLLSVTWYQPAKERFRLQIKHELKGQTEQSELLLLEKALLRVEFEPVTFRFVSIEKDILRCHPKNDVTQFYGPLWSFLAQRLSSQNPWPPPS